MKTVKQLNLEAGECAAIYWVRSAEDILKRGDEYTPAKLSDYTRSDFSNCLIPHHFWDRAAKECPRWFLSDRNFQAVKSHALTFAALMLKTLGPEKFPKTLAFFSPNRLSGTN